MHVPGLKGYSKFGLYNVNICANSKCRTEDYHWLNKFTAIWGSDVNTCNRASKTIAGLMGVGVVTAIITTAIAIAQLANHSAVKTSTAVNMNGLCLLASTVMFISSAGVWVAQCHERLDESTTTTLSWGFGMAVASAGLTFIALLVELLTPPPYDEAPLAGGAFVPSTSSTGLLAGQTVHPMPHGSSYTTIGGGAQL